VLVALGVALWLAGKRLGVAQPRRLERASDDGVNAMLAD
jgi:hypothetical protein